MRTRRRTWEWLCLCKSKCNCSHFLGKFYLEPQGKIKIEIYILLTLLVSLHGDKAV